MLDGAHRWPSGLGVRVCECNPCTSGTATAPCNAVLVGSADGADIVADAGTLDWPETSDGSDSTRTVTVPLLHDDVAEPIERAFVRLSNPTGGAALGEINMASVFVGDPGQAASVGFAETRIAVDEGAERLIATVKRLGSPLGAVSVDYEVTSISASPGSDYVDVEPGRLSWADGDATARTVVVRLVEDVDEELAEQFEIRLSSPTGATLADDRLVVDINADGMAATGFMLFDDETRQDLQPITDRKRLAPDAVPADPGIRVEVRNPDGVEDGVGSVGLTVDGTDQTHTDNDAPYVFHVLGETPDGTYTLHATPYSEDDLGGNAGQPLGVTFSIGDALPVLSSDATLHELELSGIDFAFAGDTETYEVMVGPQVDRTTISATPALRAAYVISPGDEDSDMADHQVALAPGTNVVDIAVTAEDGETTRKYTVKVIRAWFVTGP